MSDSSNVFAGGGNGWSAGIGGLIGAAIGENGFLGGGNKGNAVTPDQLGVAMASLQGNIQRDNMQEQIAHSTGALGLGLGSVKDSVASAASQNALSLCGLGHAVTAGFAQTNATILSTAASAERLALQQALDAERSRATELRIALSETKNQASHTATQVLVQNLINSGNP